MSRVDANGLFAAAALNAWLVVFILPINSALNPIIYTLAAPTDLHRRLFKDLRRLWQSVQCHKRFYLGKHDGKKESGAGEVALNTSLDTGSASDATHSSRLTRSSNGSVMSMTPVNGTTFVTVFNTRSA